VTAAVPLHFFEEGDGPLVVLLHGFPESSHAWRHQMPALARAGFRVVAPDLRGYGRSAKPRDVDSYRLTAIVEDVRSLIAKLGGAPCIVVGDDWGAFTAWYLAMSHPELVRKLVILNVPHPAPLSREVRRSTRQKLRLLYQLLFRIPVLPETLMWIFGRPVLRMLGTFSRDDVAAYAKQWRDSYTPMFHYYRAVPRARRELRRLIRPIDIPTLLIWGEREPVFTRATTENFREWVPNARVAIVPEAGHFVQEDAPEEVTRLLLEFCATPATAPQPS
jgi:epoxide hydrolase 4